MKPKIESLPKWAQGMLQEAKADIRSRDHLIEVLVEMNKLLSEHKDLQFMRISQATGVLSLWKIENEEKVCLVTLRPGDVLFVGRKK